MKSYTLFNLLVLALLVPQPIHYLSADNKQLFKPEKVEITVISDSSNESDNSDPDSIDISLIERDYSNYGNPFNEETDEEKKQNNNNSKQLQEESRFEREMAADADKRRILADDTEEIKQKNTPTKSITERDNVKKSKNKQHYKKSQLNDNSNPNFLQKQSSFQKRVALDLKKSEALTDSSEKIEKRPGSPKRKVSKNILPKEQSKKKLPSLPEELSLDENIAIDLKKGEGLTGNSHKIEQRPGYPKRKTSNFLQKKEHYHNDNKNKLASLPEESSFDEKIAINLNKSEILNDHIHRIELVPGSPKIKMSDNKLQKTQKKEENNRKQQNHKNKLASLPEEPSFDDDVAIDVNKSEVLTDNTQKVAQTPVSPKKETRDPTIQEKQKEKDHSNQKLNNDNNLEVMQQKPSAPALEEVSIDPDKSKIFPDNSSKIEQELTFAKKNVNNNNSQKNLAPKIKINNSNTPKKKLNPSKNGSLIKMEINSNKQLNNDPSKANSMNRDDNKEYNFPKKEEISNSNSGQIAATLEKTNISSSSENKQSGKSNHHNKAKKPQQVKATPNSNRKKKSNTEENLISFFNSFTEEGKNKVVATLISNLPNVKISFTDTKSLYNTRTLSATLKSKIDNSLLDSCLPIEIKITHPITNKYHTLFFPHNRGKNGLLIKHDKKTKQKVFYMKMEDKEVKIIDIIKDLKKRNRSQPIDQFKNYWLGIDDSTYTPSLFNIWEWGFRYGSIRNMNMLKKQESKRKNKLMRIFSGKSKKNQTVAKNNLDQPLEVKITSNLLNSMEIKISLARCYEIQMSTGEKQKYTTTLKKQKEDGYGVLVGLDPIQELRSADNNPIAIWFDIPYILKYFSSEPLQDYTNSFWIDIHGTRYTIDAKTFNAYLKTLKSMGNAIKEHFLLHINYPKKPLLKLTATQATTKSTTHSSIQPAATQSTTKSTTHSSIQPATTKPTTHSSIQPTEEKTNIVPISKGQEEKDIDYILSKLELEDSESTQKSKKVNSKSNLSSPRTRSKKHHYSEKIKTLLLGYAASKSQYANQEDLIKCWIHPLTDQLEEEGYFEAAKSIRKNYSISPKSSKRRQFSSKVIKPQSDKKVNSKELIKKVIMQLKSDEEEKNFAKNWQNLLKYFKEDREKAIEAITNLLKILENKGDESSLAFALILQKKLDFLNKKQAEQEANTKQLPTENTTLIGNDSLKSSDSEGTEISEENHEQLSENTNINSLKIDVNDREINQENQSIEDESKNTFLNNSLEDQGYDSDTDTGSSNRVVPSTPISTTTDEDNDSLLFEQDEENQSNTILPNQEADKQIRELAQNQLKSSDENTLNEESQEKPRKLTQNNLQRLDQSELRELEQGKVINSESIEGRQLKESDSTEPKVNKLTEQKQSKLIEPENPNIRAGVIPAVVAVTTLGAAALIAGTYSMTRKKEEDAEGE